MEKVQKKKVKRRKHTRVTCGDIGFHGDVILNREILHYGEAEASSEPIQLFAIRFKC